MLKNRPSLQRCSENYLSGGETNFSNVKYEAYTLTLSRRRIATFLLTDSDSFLDQFLTNQSPVVDSKI